MPIAFTPLNLGSLEIKNRLVRSATWEGTALADGSPTMETALFSAAPALGGVGLVITGFAFTHPQGRALPRQTGAHIDAMIGPLARVADAVHKSGGKVALQLAHAGARAMTGQGAGLGPSPMRAPRTGREVKALTIPQMEHILEGFALAAIRAREAGFDAVQIQAAHGYLIDQFLSPLTNRRSDSFGGTLANRARFCLLVCRAVREALGPLFPVLVKMTSTDGLDGGFSPDEAVKLAQWLVKDGVDALEISGGVAEAGAMAPVREVHEEKDEGYFLLNAARIKKAVDCPVIAVGGFRSLAKVEQALLKVDAVAMSRPLIREPDLVEKWRLGTTRKAECISCQGCMKLGLEDETACAKLHPEEVDCPPRPC